MGIGQLDSAMRDSPSRGRHPDHALCGRCTATTASPKRAQMPAWKSSTRHRKPSDDVPTRSLDPSPAPSHAWDGLDDSTTHGQDDGGQNREAAKRAKASGRQQKTISVVNGCGCHPGHQSGGRGPGQVRVPSSGRSRQGMARAAPCAEKVSGGLRWPAAKARDRWRRFS